MTMRVRSIPLPHAMVVELTAVRGRGLLRKPKKISAKYATQRRARGASYKSIACLSVQRQAMRQLQQSRRNNTGGFDEAVYAERSIYHVVCARRYTATCSTLK
jgi:hypothetical protein